MAFTRRRQAGAAIRESICFSWNPAARLLAGALVAMLGPACSRRSGEAVRPPLAGSTSIVARVDGVDIALESLRAEAARRGLDPPSAQNISALLEERLHFQLVLSEARRTGFDQTPDLREKWERFVVGRYLEEQEQAQAAASASEAECRAWYDRHRDRFGYPARVNLALVQVRVPSNADAQRREEARRRVGELRARAEAEAGAERDFGVVAMENSDHQASRYKGGEVGWLTREQAAELLGAAVAEAAFALENAGQIGPAVETADGFYLLKLIERQEAGFRPFEEVREAVAEQMKRERMAERREALYAELRARAAVEINEPLMANLRKSDESSRAPEPPRLPAP